MATVRDTLWAETPGRPARKPGLWGERFPAGGGSPEHPLFLSEAAGRSPAPPPARRRPRPHTPPLSLTWFFGLRPSVVEDGRQEGLTKTEILGALRSSDWGR